MTYISQITLPSNETYDLKDRRISNQDITTWNNGSSGEPNVQSNWNENDSTSDAYIQNKPTLLSVKVSETSPQQPNTGDIWLILDDTTIPEQEEVDNSLY